MRQASVSFPNVTIKSGIITKNILRSVIDALPSDSSFVGVNDGYADGKVRIHVTSSSFKDLNEGDLIPEIDVHFDLDEFQIPQFTRLDMSSALDSSQGCSHVWREYVGIMEVFRYCEKCNEKEKPCI